MTPKPADPDSNEHVRGQIRTIIAEEDRTCLGVKVRPPIPVSEVERIALATLRRTIAERFEPKAPGSPD
jgi:hypothetical protein